MPDQPRSPEELAAMGFDSETTSELQTSIEEALIQGDMSHVVDIVADATDKKAAVEALLLGMKSESTPGGVQELLPAFLSEAIKNNSDVAAAVIKYQYTYATEESRFLLNPDENPPGYLMVDRDDNIVCIPFDSQAKVEGDPHLKEGDEGYYSEQVIRGVDKMVILTGPKKGEEVALSGNVVIGKAADTFDI